MVINNCMSGADGAVMERVVDTDTDSSNDDDDGINSCKLDWATWTYDRGDGRSTTLLGTNTPMCCLFL